MGESAQREVIERIERVLARKSEIAGVNQLLTMHLGPSDVLLTISLDFKDRLSSGDVEDTVSELESEIKAAVPEVSRVFIEAQQGRKAPSRPSG